MTLADRLSTAIRNLDEACIAVNTARAEIDKVYAHNKESITRDAFRVLDSCMPHIAKAYRVTDYDLKSDTCMYRLKTNQEIQIEMLEDKVKNLERALQSLL